MNIPVRFAMSIAIAITIAGCSAGPSSLVAPSSVVVPAAAAPVHSSGSWMSPRAKTIKKLIYLSNESANVYVFDYATMQQVGGLGGLRSSGPQCVDAKGDIWILDETNGNTGSGNAFEYAHGGTTLLNEVTTSGPPAACSVSSHGDLAITAGGTLNSSFFFTAGAVQIWKNGTGTPQTIPAVGGCYHPTSGTYDNHGNIYITGMAESGSTPSVCRIKAGGSAFEPVTLDKTGIYADSIMWDGKDLAVTETYYTTRDDVVTTILQTTERHGGAMLHVGRATSLSDTCFDNEVDVYPAPFISDGIVAGFNFTCGVNPSYFRVWRYPAGGAPKKKESQIPSGAGESLSIGR